MELNQLLVVQWLGQQWTTGRLCLLGLVASIYAYAGKLGGGSRRKFFWEVRFSKKNF